MQQPPDLSIIIVNYKTPQLIINCLDTVYAGTKKISFEVVVVDNDSGDNSKQLILASHPHVIWVDMKYNSGFARANNEGIRQSKSDTVLLLNSDTLILDNALEKCFQLFKSSEYVASGVQLLNADLSPQISGNYFVRGGLNYLLPLPYTGAFVKWLGGSLKIKKPNLPDSDSLVEVDWINGAFLMVKKAAIEKAGLMDEDFFLYAEEAEWCSRLKKIGKLCIFGECKVVHIMGSTATGTFNSDDKSYYNIYDKKGLQLIVSNFVRIRKQYGVLWFLVMLFFYSIEILVFFLGLIVAKLLMGKKSRFSFTQFSGYCRNIFSLLRLGVTIIKNKPFFYKAL
ncbi:MAG: glycosyltransferase family 2 protein [Bacteroidetes bacterium]|nr:glycosyltransferase family 2 protein [Bacteroidota bacterium]